MFRKKYMIILDDHKDKEISEMIEKYDSCEKLLGSYTNLLLSDQSVMTMQSSMTVAENICNMFIADSEYDMSNIENIISFNDKTNYLEYFDTYTYGIGLMSKVNNLICVKNICTSIGVQVGVKNQAYRFLFDVFVHYLTDLQKMYENKRNIDETMKHQFVTALLTISTPDLLFIRFRYIIEILINNTVHDDTFHYILMGTYYEETNCINFFVKCIIRCFFSDATHFVYINNHKIRHVDREDRYDECECCGDHLTKGDTEYSSHSSMYYIVFGLIDNLCVKDKKKKKPIIDYKKRLFETKDRVKRKMVLLGVLPHTYLTKTTVSNYEITGNRGEIHKDETLVYINAIEKNLYSTNLIGVQINFKFMFSTYFGKKK
jgi:hypothetical protein